MRRVQALLACAVLLAAVAPASGCGEGEVSSGATVSVYVSARLCPGAEAGLGGSRGTAGDLRVHVVCLPPVEKKGGADLAAAGANARQAIEDSTSVAFLEAPGPAAEFAEPIVEAADLAWLEAESGATAIRRVLRALEARGSSSPRSAVLDQVG